MKRRLAIAALLGALAAGALYGAAFARDCGWRCTELAQNRDRERDFDGERRYRPPFLRGYDTRRGWRERERDFGGPGERRRRFPTSDGSVEEPLPDRQIWSIVRSRVPGRIINARLHGQVYSFRILSHRGSIVDVVVDRYSGRIVSVRGGP